MTICLDTSLIIKLVINEPESIQAGQNFRQWIELNERLITPSFTRYEAYSVLRKKHFLKELTDEQLDSALKDFQSLPLEYINDISFLPKAMAWAKRLKQPVIYDCLYLCITEADDAVFWTCDLKFYKLAKQEFPRIEALTLGGH